MGGVFAGTVLTDTLLNEKFSYTSCYLRDTFFGPHLSGAPMGNLTWAPTPIFGLALLPKNVIAELYHSGKQPDFLGEKVAPSCFGQIQKSEINFRCLEPGEVVSFQAAR